PAWNHTASVELGQGGGSAMPDEGVVLQRVMSALDAAHVPDELRPVAFCKVFDLVERELRGGSPPPSTKAEEHKDEAGNAGVGVDGQGLINRVATRLRLD